MHHDHCIEGAALRLRPVAEGDAAFIAALRADPALNRHLNAGATTEAAQLEWLRGYFSREGDWYFVAESLAAGRAEGVVGIYAWDAQANAAEWGRWVMRPGSLAAIECAWLTYRIAFEQLGLAEVYCRTLAGNAAVVSFHDSCGIVRRSEPPGFVEHRVSPAEWPAIDARLQPLARRAARRLQHAAA